MGVETWAVPAALLIAAVALAVSVAILVAYGRAEKQLIRRRVQRIRALAALLLAPPLPEDAEQPAAPAPHGERY